MNAVPADYSNPSLQPGSPEPLGATWTGEGVNFAVYSSGAARIELCLFDEHGERELHALALPERTENVWHGFLPAPAARPGSCTGCARTVRTIRCTVCATTRTSCCSTLMRVRSPGKFEWNAALLGSCAGMRTTRPMQRDSAPHNYKARVIDGAFDWGDDRPPATPWRDTVIYEAHVKGFTKLHPTAPEARARHVSRPRASRRHRASETPRRDRDRVAAGAGVRARAVPRQRKDSSNYWGYSSLAWFAPAPQYAIEDRGRRVQDDGQGAARRRARGHSRRRLQSHGRGRRARSDPEPARPRQRRVLQARDRRICATT